jgi:hypothetical protein
MPQLLLLTRNVPDAIKWKFVIIINNWVFVRSTIAQARPDRNAVQGVSWRWSRQLWRWTCQFWRWTQMKISTWKLAALRKVTAG